MKKFFSSTKTYIANEQLIEAVNSSIILEKPLLIKGEPGTGKTQLAEEIAKNLDETCPHFMNPRTIIILDELPTNSNGKLSRLQLADMFNNKN